MPRPLWVWRCIACRFSLSVYMSSIYPSITCKVFACCAYCIICLTRKRCKGCIIRRSPRACSCLAWYCVCHGLPSPAAGTILAGRSLVGRVCVLTCAGRLAGLYRAYACRSSYRLCLRAGVALLAGLCLACGSDHLASMLPVACRLPCVRVAYHHI